MQSDTRSRPYAKALTSRASVVAAEPVADYDIAVAKELDAVVGSCLPEAVKRVAQVHSDPVDQGKS